MSQEEACRIVHHHRCGLAGADEAELALALDTVLAAVRTLGCALASTRARLARCQVQRERFHAQLRSRPSA